MKKRLMCLLMALIVPLTTLGGTAIDLNSSAQTSVNESAEEKNSAKPDSKSTNVSSITYGNTLVKEKQNYNIRASDTTNYFANFVSHASFNNVNSTVQYIREQMKKRTQTISFTVSNDVVNKLNKIHTYDEYYKYFYNEAPNYLDILASEVIKHTGKSDEGDYIKWQYGAMHSHGRTNPDNSNEVQITMKPDYYSNALQENKTNIAVKHALANLNLKNKNNYQKCKIIYNYICRNVTYDNAHVNNKSYKIKYSAYGAIINKTAVCQGISNLMYRMLLAEGIDCRIVTSDNHAWNIVKIDGKYYNCDATWDLATENNGVARYDYFLISNNTMRDLKHDNTTSHIREYPYNTVTFNRKYPMSSVDYSKAHKHKYSAWKTTRKSTCKLYGIAQRKCSTCGHVEQKKLPLLKHQLKAVKKVKATIKSPGYTLFKCKVCGKTVKSRFTYAYGLSGLQTYYAYTGRKINPAFRVVRSGRVLRKNIDYTISFKRNIKPGKAAVVVRLKGKYKGTIVRYFYITQNITFKKLTVSGNKILANLRGLPNVSGYQVSVYGKTSRFTSKGFATSHSKNTVNFTFRCKRGLNIRYRVQARYYVRVNGRTVYGKWRTGYVRMR